jgi:hypothetical protein
MPIHFTVDAAVSMAADRWLAYKYPRITVQRKAQIKEATKYNLLVKAFNYSTVLLVAAVACAILFAYAAAVTFGGIALFVRFTSDGELGRYSEPRGEEEEPFAWLRSYYHRCNPDTEIRRIFQRIGGEAPEKWTQHEILVFDHVVWRNEVPLPDSAL